jgi:outer membrane lipoprotein carrier protein
MNRIKIQRFSVVICAAVSLLLILSAAEGQEVVSAILDKIQNKYTGMYGFSADFKQTFLSADTGTSLEESGSLVIKKGGFMRWEYNAPDEKLFICDSKDCYNYIIEEKIAQVISLKNIDARSTPMLFFTGKGDLKRDFNAEYLNENAVYGKEPSSHKIKLIPKGGQEQFEYLVAIVDKKSFFIIRLLVVDLLGNQTEYIFDSLKELKSIPDSEFKFTPPEGVEIVNIEE